MEHELWDRFTATGRVEDYLSYKQSVSGKNGAGDEADGGRAGDMGDEDGGSGQGDNSSD